MTIRPFTTMTFNGTDYIIDGITVTYSNTPFDRVEFDHTKLSQARLSNGVSPIIVQLLGGVPAEVSFVCAVGGGYTPRPLTPNSYPATWNNIKQKIKAVRYKVTSGQTPETVNDAADVLSLYNTFRAHASLITQFNNRLAVFNGDIAYEVLLAAQSDDLSTFFNTGIDLVTPDATVNNSLIVEFNYGVEFAIPNGLGGFEVYKGFDMTVESRGIDSAGV